MNDQLLKDLMSTFSILLNHIALYPSGHGSVQKSCSDVMSAFSSCVQDITHLQLDFYKDQLRVNQKEYTALRKQVSAVVRFFHQRGIVSIRMMRDMTQSDLLDVLGLLISMPQQSHMIYHPEIEQALSKFSTIELKSIDLAAVHYSDDLILDGVTTDETQGIWDYLVWGETRRETPLTSRRDSVKSIQFNAVLERYTTLLNGFKVQENETGTLREKQVLFQTVKDLLPALEPQQKEQMLTVTFDSIDMTDEEQTLFEMIGSMPSDLLSELIGQAQREKKEISPTLVRIVNALHHIQTETDPNDALEFNRTNHQKFVNFTPEQVGKLIEREHIEEYLPSDYSDQLSEIVLLDEASQLMMSHSEVYQAYQEQFDEQYMIGTVALALTGVLDSDLPKDIRADLQVYTVDLILLLATNQQWGVLKEILHKHDFLTQEDLKKLWLNVAEQFLKLPDPLDVEFKDILVILGNSELTLISELYFKSESVEKSNLLLSIILQSQLNLEEYITKHLLIEDIGKLKKLITLLQHAEQSVAEDVYRSLLDQKELPIAYEAVRYVVNQRRDLVIEHLLKHWEARELTSKYYVLDCLHAFKLEELVPEVLSSMTFFIVTKNRYRLYCELSDAFHNLSESAIETLNERLGQVRFTLTPRSFKRLKEYSKRGTL